MKLTTSGSGHGIAVDAPLTSTATVYLESAGTITSDGAGVITANKLNGTSDGDISLSAANDVTVLGQFTTDNGAFSFTNAAPLTVVQTPDGIDSGTGTLTLTSTGASNGIRLDGTLTGGAVDLVSSANIDNNRNGIITAGTFTRSAVQKIMPVYAVNDFQNLGALSSANNTIDLTTGPGFTVTGAVSAPLGQLFLTTTGASSNITIDAPMTSPLYHVTATGNVTQDGAGILTTTGTYGTLNVIAGVTITLNASNEVAAAALFTTNNDNISFNDATSVLMLGAGGATGTANIVTLTTTGADSNMNIGKSVSAETVNFSVGGEITEENGTSINANLLNVTANTGIELTSDNNDITTIGTDHTNSGPNEIDQH